MFDFTTDGATSGAIVVKGGPNHNVYIFAGGTEGADGLHSPLNPKNGKWYGLSHLCIESEKKDESGKK